MEISVRNRYFGRRAISIGEDGYTQHGCDTILEMQRPQDEARMDMHSPLNRGGR